MSSDAYGSRRPPLTPARSAEEVWAALEADPEFVAGMARSEADFAAGRTYRWEHRDDGSVWSVANPAWPKDDPDQPHPPRCISRAPARHPSPRGGAG